MSKRDEESDVEKPARKHGRRARLAPVERPGRKGAPGRYKRVEEDGRANKIPRILSPIQVRVLDACFDPRCATRTDVAHVANVSEKVITRWIAEHPLFRDEFFRRVQLRGDEIVSLQTEAIRLAWQFHIKVLRDETGKYTKEDQYRSAKAVMESSQPRIDAINQINIQQNVGASPGPMPGSEATTIASVRRLTATGMSEDDALRMDAQEMRLVIEQIAAGGLQVGSDENVLDGEVVDVPRTG